MNENIGNPYSYVCNNVNNIYTTKNINYSHENNTLDLKKELINKVKLYIYRNDENNEKTL